MKLLKKKKLYNAEPGDPILISMEGTRGKYRTRLLKRVSNNRLIDTDGNIWNRNGRIFRRKAWYCWFGYHTQPKKMTAELIGQSHFDKRYKQTKIDHLKKHDWERYDVDFLNKIIDMLDVKQGNELEKSRFS